MSAVSFRDGPAKRTQGLSKIHDAAALGEKLAVQLK
jgi:hypothetical protein